jgi:calcium-dependent phosphoinositide phospholipase C
MRWRGHCERAGWLGLFFASVTAGTCAPASEPRFNQLQVIGSHNSYHIAPAPSVQQMLVSRNPQRAQALDYSHRPLAEQFSRLGIRQVELDVYADPKGGLFASPAARAIVRGLGKEPGDDPDAHGALREPGLKILHVPDIDFRTTAPTFVDALKQIRAWSGANRRHVPILILVELKGDALPGLPARPVPFGKDEIESVDAEILAVFEKREILTPDRVRGKFGTLPEAIKAQGWPALEDVRGLVMFALDNEGSVRDLYLEGHRALKGRVMFASVAPLDPAAAWFKINDPIKDHDRIKKLVREGFLVRTRADADTVQSRKNDGTQRDKALSSGAQFVSTDYAEPDRRFSEYSVRFPRGQVARSNPISGDPSWYDLDLETAKPVAPPR